MENQTDLETIKSMLVRAGINFEEDDWDDGKTITVEDGYVNFVSVHYFNKDGSLVRIAAWE